MNCYKLNSHNNSRIWLAMYFFCVSVTAVHYCRMNENVMHSAEYKQVWGDQTGRKYVIQNKVDY